MQKAWTELSSFGEANVNNLSHGLTNDVNICEEQNEDRLSTEITELNEEICILRREDARYAAVNKKVHEVYKLKESLQQENKLRAKISDLEREIHTLKQENLKLSENLTLKITEFREIDATQSVFKEQICLMENENVGLSETLEGSVKDVQSLNCKILNLKELGKLTSENIKFKKEISILSDEMVNLSKSLDVATKATKLLSENSEVKEEICFVRNDNLNLSDPLEGKILEIKQVSSENSIQWDEVCPVRSNDAKIAQLHEHNAENGKLMDEISSLKCEIMTPSSECTDEKVMKIRELSSENLLLKKEIYSHRVDITHLLACVKEKSIKIQELHSQNNKLKEEMSFLKQNMLKISESREEKIIEIQKVVNENIVLKNMGSKISEEMVMKVEELNFEKSLLKENISRLLCKLKEKAVEVSELSSKLEEGKLEADNLKTDVSILRKEILLLYCENINLSKMLNQKMQEIQPLMVPDTKYEVFSRQNIACMKGNARFSKTFSQKHEEMDRHKLKAKTLPPDRMKSSFQKAQLREKPQSVCTNPVMKIILQEEQRQNCLRQKVAPQRRILNTIQKRELRTKTNMELCKEISLYFC